VMMGTIIFWNSQKSPRDSFDHRLSAWWPKRRLLMPMIKDLLYSMLYRNRLW
jgi:hypothetical protein